MSDPMFTINQVSYTLISDSNNINLKKKKSITWTKQIWNYNLKFKKDIAISNK